MMHKKNTEKGLQNNRFGRSTNALAEECAFYAC